MTGLPILEVINKSGDLRQKPNGVAGCGDHTFNLGTQEIQAGRSL